MLSWIAKLKPSWYFRGVLSWCAVRCVNTIYQECILTWYVFIRHMFTSIQRSNVRTRSAKKHIKIHLCNPAWWEGRADVFWESSYVDESRLRGFTLIWLLFYAVYHLVFFSQWMMMMTYQKPTCLTSSHLYTSCLGALPDTDIGSDWSQL